MEKQFADDIQRIQELDIVPTILEMVCRTTGMGFSAVARVTDQRWIACAVKDDIGFGLKPGGELQLETTICNEIRGHGLPVVIDHVDQDPYFSNHHTPKMYGFQSYLSIPILLKDGSFFGTLCAIDPRPFPLKTGNMLALLTLFADLISFHLLAKEQLQLKNALLRITRVKLDHSQEEIQQLTHVNNHSLQEPLRKLQVYADMIKMEQNLKDEERVKLFAQKIGHLAGSFSAMIQDVSQFGRLNTASEFQSVDLNKVVAAVLKQLQPQVDACEAVIFTEVLPVIPGNQQQVNQLFYNLLENALRFCRPETASVVTIAASLLEPEEIKSLGTSAIHPSYYRISITDNGIGLKQEYLSKVFDPFVKLDPKDKFEGLGNGLTQVKKIIRNHDGAINVQSTEGQGTTFVLILPCERLELP